jgi:G3E family GTPase
VGCSLATSLVCGIKRIWWDLTPDFIFIEPSEMVVMREMRNVTAMAHRDVAYDVGPFITLVDGPTFPSLWQERQPLLLGQIAGADLVAVSKSDLMGAEGLEEIANALNSHCHGVLLLSARSGSGMEEVVKKIEGSS